MEKDIFILYFTVFILQTFSTLCWISDLMDREHTRNEIKLLNERICDIKRTDEWFNTIHTNTIAVVSDFMLRNEEKKWARTISESLLVNLSTDRDPYHAMGYENPTNAITGTFSGYRYVDGILMGMETNSMNQAITQ